MARAELPWKPLEIDKEPVIELRAFPHRLPRADGGGSVFAYMIGTARTTSRDFKVLWTRDKLDGFPAFGEGSLPEGSWRADIVDDPGRHTVRVGDNDAWREIANTPDPVSVIAAIGEMRPRVLVFGDAGTGKLKIARSTDAGEHWKVSDLPTVGNVEYAVDGGGLDLALAWNVGDQGRWLHVRSESAEKLPAPEKLSGAITSACSNEMLWVATAKSVQRLPYGQAFEFASAPEILTCSADAAIVRLSDGSVQRCSSYECKADTLPSGSWSQLAIIGDDLVAIEPRADMLAITRGGKRVEYASGGAIARLEMFDFGGELVLVVFGSDTTRWAIVPRH